MDDIKKRFILQYFLSNLNPMTFQVLFSKHYKLLEKINETEYIIQCNITNEKKKIQIWTEMPFCISNAKPYVIYHNDKKLYALILSSIDNDRTPNVPTS